MNRQGYSTGLHEATNSKKIIQQEKSVEQHQTATVVLFQRANVMDKLIVSMHGTFRELTNIPVSETPVFDEVKYRIAKKNVYVIGGGFSEIYMDIARVSKSVIFVLRTTDKKPDIDNLISGCSIENWFVYWNALGLNSPIIASIDAYLNKYPSMYDRCVYYGLIDKGILSIEAKELDEFFQYYTQKDQLYDVGKNIIVYESEVIVRRLNSSMIIETSTIDRESIEVHITFADTMLNETAFQLLEAKQGDFAMSLYVRCAGKEPMVCGTLVTRNEVGATMVCKTFFENATGTQFVASGSGKLIDFMKFIYPFRVFEAPK